MYKITIKGIAANLKMNNNITELIKNAIRIIFSWFFKASPLLILSENSGNSATKSMDKITVETINNSKLKFV